jgi:hypothetical protein
VLARVRPKVEVAIGNPLAGERRAVPGSEVGNESSDSSAWYDTSRTALTRVGR